MNNTQLSRGLRLFPLWRSLSSRLDILVSTLAGFAIGMALLVFGPTQTLAGAFALLYVLVLLKAPELAILLVLVLTSGLLPGEYNPSFNLFVGHFQLADLILISLLGITVVRLLLDRGFKLRSTPLYLPLILFCLAVVGGMITSVVKHGTLFSDTTYEARVLLYYSLFFAVVNLIRTRQQAHLLMYGTFAVGVLVALSVIAQIIWGSSINLILPGYLKPDLLVRAYHPGFIAIYMSMMALMCLLAFKIVHRWRTVAWVVILLLVLANTISLGRNIIISSLVALLMLFILLSSSQRKTWLQNMLIVSILAVGSFSVLKVVSGPTGLFEYPAALAQRFYHLFTTDPLSPEETLLWRVQEADYAWDHISESPLLGIGMSVGYRPPFSERDTMQRYIHNGYLWVWLKTGLVGLIAFVSFLLMFVVHGLRKWAHIHDTLLSAATLGFSLVIVAMLASDFVAPLLVENFNLAFFAAGMGVAEAAIALEKEAATIPHASLGCGGVVVAQPETDLR